MAQLKQFNLPDVGEGLTEAEILSWRVAPGDEVTVNQIIVEIETAKAAVELPCPWAGRVAELLVKEGETVEVGTPIITVDVDPAVAGPAGGGEGMPDQVASAPAEGAVEPGLIGGPAPGGRTSVLVGYGPRTTTATRRPRKGVHVPLPPAPAPVKPTRHGGLEMGRAIEAHALAETEPGRPLAKPLVRKLARQLGVDLTRVPGTGPHGSITRADVEAAAGAPAGALTGDRARVSADLRTVGARDRGLGRSGGAAREEREERLPIKGVRKVMAEAMVASAFTAPHVTEWVQVDVTRSMRLVERLKGRPEFAGVRVSPLLLVAKALLLAVRRHPLINATWDDAAQEIVVKHYVNLGIAAATPRGLIVPNIKDADQLSLPELAGALTELTTIAREGRTPPADMTGGTITITNVGVFGVDNGTPILNPGEVAILGFGQVRALPWVHKGKVVPRQVTQLTLSFDHRLVDGELGSRVLADVAAVLERPELALLYC